MKHQRVIDDATLPDADERLRQEQAIGDALARAGLHADRPRSLRQAGRSAVQAAQRKGRLRRNFQGYTDDPADALIGFGASSIGQLPQGYVQNASDIKGWSDRIEAGELATVRGFAITPEDDLRGESSNG